MREKIYPGKGDAKKAGEQGKYTEEEDRSQLVWMFPKSSLEALHK